MHVELEEDVASRREESPPHRVVVHDCACHTFHDVIFGLMRIVGTGMRDAELKAKEIDFFGSGVVATAPRDEAEALARRLRDEVVSATGTRLRVSVEPT